MTTTFYAPPENIRSGRLALPEEEARHAARVLRHKVGDVIDVVDGEGGWYRAVLDHIDERSVAARILETYRERGEPPYQLTLAVGLIKNRSRFEVFLEKAVELGVSRVIPLITERTEKERLRHGRARKLLISAMKQCGRSRLVELNAPLAFANVISRPHDAVICCHEAPGGRDFYAALQDHAAAATILILIGPEGGFSEAEVTTASAAAAVVRLCERRLRTETAAITAAAGVMMTRMSPER